MTQLVDWQIQEEQEKSLLPFIRNKVDDDNPPHPLINPYRPEQLQPASYDLRLGRQLRSQNGLAWDMRERVMLTRATQVRGGGYRYEDMEPGMFVLGHTVEYVRMPANLCGRVEGKSSIGRQGLAVHVTAGFIDPGFQGQITLELKYQGTLRHMKIWPGMLIAQITFHRLDAIPRRLYGSPGLGSHYQGQLGATPPAK